MKLRHEAAEALGAIEAPASLAILERYAADAASEVSSTCQLALSHLNHKIAKGACGCERRPQEALLAEAEVATPLSMCVARTCLCFLRLRCVN